MAQLHFLWADSIPVCVSNAFSLCAPLLLDTWADPTNYLLSIMLQENTEGQASLCCVDSEFAGSIMGRATAGSFGRPSSASGEASILVSVVGASVCPPTSRE